MTTDPTAPAAWLSYARASKDEQTTSCGQQHAENDRAAASPASARFDDDGVRGHVLVDARRGFRALLEHLARHPAGTFAVRAYDTSRVGRFLDPEEHFAVERELRRAGARAVLYTRGNYSGKRSVGDSVLKAVEAHANLAYSAKLSDNVHRGKIDAVRRGERSGGFAPFGYDIEYLANDGSVYARVRHVPVPEVTAAHPIPGHGHARAFTKHVTYATGASEILPPDRVFVAPTRPVRSRLVPGDPARVMAVRRIFTRYAEGAGFKKIADELREAALPSPEGRSWSFESVRAILRNPVYSGRLVYGRWSKSKLSALEVGGHARPLEDAETQVLAARAWRSNDPARWVSTDATHEPLCDAKSFAEVQARVQDRAAHRDSLGGRAVAKREYLLSGLLWCPRCGAPYHAHYRKNARGVASGDYVCGLASRGIGCERGAVGMRTGDEVVVDWLRDLYQTRLPVNRMRESVARAMRAEMRGLAQPERDPRVGELEKVNAELAAIVRSVSAENLSLFDARLTQLRGRRDDLASALSREPARAQSVVTASDIEQEIERALAIALRVRELLDDTAPGSIGQVRDTVLSPIVSRIHAFPADGYLEVMPAGSVPAAGADLETAPVCSGSGYYARRGSPGLHYSAADTPQRSIRLIIPASARR